MTSANWISLTSGWYILGLLASGGAKMGDYSIFISQSNNIIHIKNVKLKLKTELLPHICTKDCEGLLPTRGVCGYQE